MLPRWCALQAAPRWGNSSEQTAAKQTRRRAAAAQNEAEKAALISSERCRWKRGCRHCGRAQRLQQVENCRWVSQTGVVTGASRLLIGTCRRLLWRGCRPQPAAHFPPLRRQWAAGGHGVSGERSAGAAVPATDLSPAAGRPDPPHTRQARQCSSRSGAHGGAATGAGAGVGGVAAVGGRRAGLPPSRAALAAPALERAAVGVAGAVAAAVAAADRPRESVSWDWQVDAEGLVGAGQLPVAAQAVLLVELGEPLGAAVAIVGGDVAGGHAAARDMRQGAAGSAARGRLSPCAVGRETRRNSGTGVAPSDTRALTCRIRR